MTSPLLIPAAPGPGVAAHNLYLGALDGLHRLGEYGHMKSLAGVAFPDSPAADDGCDAAGGPRTSARVSGLASGSVYMLLVAVDGQGREGPYGRLPSGLDRRNPAVDPRDPSFFCPRDPAPASPARRG